MRKLFASLLLLCTLTSFGQNKSLFGNAFTNITLTGVNLDLGYSGTRFKTTTLNGFHFNASAIIGKHYSTGFYVESFSKGTIVYDSLKKAVNPKFSLNLFMWHQELMFMPQRTFNFSIPLNIGLADARYSDHYNTSGNNRTTYLQIANRTFFAAQTGLMLHLNLFSHVNMYAGAHYRYCKGASLFATDAQFSQLSFIGGVRVKLYVDDTIGAPPVKRSRQVNYRW